MQQVLRHVREAIRIGLAGIQRVNVQTTEEIFMVSAGEALVIREIDLFSRFRSIVRGIMLQARQRVTLVSSNIPGVYQ